MNSLFVCTGSFYTLYNFGDFFFPFGLGNQVIRGLLLIFK